MSASRRFDSLVLALSAALALTLSGPVAAAPEGEVNLYSARKEALIKPLLDRFTEQTGIRVNLLTGKAEELLQRLKNEGRNSPADLLVTVDAGNLHQAKSAGVTQPIDAETLTASVPANYRDPDGHWVALSLRARPILYARDRVDPSRLSTYEDLTDPRWKGRICVRSSDNVYNQSMVASLIAADGVEAAETWARGLVANLARPPQGGDRDQIKAVAVGECDLALANTYYLAGMLDSDDPAERDPARALAVFWPNQPGQGDGRGVHVNVSGVALTASARNREAALKLVEFLLTPESQAWYGQANGEYPVREGIDVSPTLVGFGPFEADELNLGQLGELNAEAVRVMDRAGWK